MIQIRPIIVSCMLFCLMAMIKIRPVIVSYLFLFDGHFFKGSYLVLPAPAAAIST